MIPGVLCLLLILFGVEDRAADEGSQTPDLSPTSKHLLSFSILHDPYFRSLVRVIALFSLARFSNAFIVLRAADVGFATAVVPLLLMGMNFVFSLSSYPFGQWADRTTPGRLLAVGLGFLLAADLVFALLPTQWGILLGLLCMGLHLGATQGIFIHDGCKLCTQKRTYFRFRRLLLFQRTCRYGFWTSRRILMG